MFSAKGQIVNILGLMRQKTLVTTILLCYWGNKAAGCINVPSMLCSIKSFFSKACGGLDLANSYCLLTLLQKGRELLCLLFPHFSRFCLCYYHFVTAYKMYILLCYLHAHTWLALAVKLVNSMFTLVHLCCCHRVLLTRRLVMTSIYFSRF